MARMVVPPLTRFYFLPSFLPGTRQRTHALHHGWSFSLQFRVSSFLHDSSIGSNAVGNGRSSGLNSQDAVWERESTSHYRSADICTPLVLHARTYATPSFVVDTHHPRAVHFFPHRSYYTYVHIYVYIRTRFFLSIAGGSPRISPNYRASPSRTSKMRPR